MELPQFVHEALIRETLRDRLVGHIARDSTAIAVREHFPESASPGKVVELILKNRKTVESADGTDTRRAVGA